MIRILVVSIIAAAGLGCFVAAWLSHARYAAQQIERWARIYSIARNPGEPRRAFHRRVLARAAAFYRRAS